MREANGRKVDDGDGTGNGSWIGLSLGMVVLDSLTAQHEGVRTRFTGLLRRNGVSEEDANIIYAIRNSVLHGYGPPQPDAACGRIVIFTAEQDGYALNTDLDGWACLSVPVFCASLVERITAADEGNWDSSLVNVVLDETRLPCTVAATSSIKTVVLRGR